MEAGKNLTALNIELERWIEEELAMSDKAVFLTEDQMSKPPYSASEKRIKSVVKCPSHACMQDEGLHDLISYVCFVLHITYLC
jgi:hypothetical protein